MLNSAVFATMLFKDKMPGYSILNVDLMAYEKKFHFQLTAQAIMIYVQREITLVGFTGNAVKYLSVSIINLVKEEFKRETFV